MPKKKTVDQAAEATAPQRKPPIALQLYTLRSLTLSVPDLLDAVAAAGYSGVELAGTYGLPAENLRALLDARGLRAVSAHVSLEALESDLPGVVRYQKAVGNDVLIVPWLPPAQRGQTAASWQEMGQRVGHLSRRAAMAGMRTMYHNHDFEMVVIDGRPAIDWLMEGAAPEPVGFEMDVAWVVVGGQSVPELLQRYAGRVQRIHLKDVGDNPAEKGLADVGSGRIDWSTVLPAAKAAGVEWYVVEHDFPTDPLASIRHSYNFLADKIA